MKPARSLRVRSLLDLDLIGCLKKIVFQNRPPASNSVKAFARRASHFQKQKAPFEFSKGAEGSKLN
jgi:hypothetical protein